MPAEELVTIAQPGESTTSTPPESRRSP